MGNFILLPKDRQFSSIKTIKCSYLCIIHPFIGSRYQIGGCRVLFDAGTSMTDAMCVYLLEPYNAVWFCIGWFMLFSVLAVAFANQLAYLFAAIGTSHKIRPSEHHEYEDQYKLQYKQYPDQYHDQPYIGAKVVIPVTGM